MADARKKQLVFNIIEFLRASGQDGTVKEDDKESLDVAIQCIAESFGVDPESSEQASEYSLKPASLLSLLDVYLKTKSKASSSSSAAAPAASASTSTAAPAAGPSGPSAADKARAEALKGEGNALMGQKQYQAAVDKYTEAIRIEPTAVYYSNRAAAYGGMGNHEKAVEDAQAALDLDPKFAKAYSRLGHAQFSLGEYTPAIEAYEAGLKLDPDNKNMKTALATAIARRTEEGGSNDVADREAGAGAGAGAGGMPDLASLAGMFGGGGAGGAGGMPDLASLMQNPQMMQMAQQMMANGGLERLMQNPAMRRMAENMQAGGGMPDMSQLASDPSLREMAQQFMGGRQQ